LSWLDDQQGTPKIRERFQDARDQYLVPSGYRELVRQSGVDDAGVRPQWEFEQI